MNEKYLKKERRRQARAFVGSDADSLPVVGTDPFLIEESSLTAWAGEQDHLAARDAQHRRNCGE